jgi:hypothetical protein
MDRQLNLDSMPPIEKDVVFTPENIAYGIVEWLKPTGICLDPCAGDNSFLKYLPADSEWCEITRGRDFFEYSKKVNWIIGNPPYSIFGDWLIHSFEIADEVAYIVPTNKIFQRQLIMKLINDWGGVKGLMVYGSGSIIGFPFGFSVGTFYFSKGYKGKCELILKTQ